MKKYLLFILLIILYKTSISQITFQKQINVNGFEAGYSVKQTSDGGYIIAGFTNSAMLLVKTNEYGDTIWTKAYTQGLGIIVFDACITDNGDYVVTGFDADSVSNDLFIARFDTNGDTIWTRKFGGSRFDAGYGLCKTNDGSFVSTGQTRSFGDTLGDLYLIKVDENGILQWQKTYGSDQLDYGYSVKNTVDSGFIIAGQKAGKQYVLKTSSVGDTSWTKSFSMYNSCDILPTNDGYINISYNLTKLDLNGEIIWQKPNYGGRSITKTNDGGYAFVTSFIDGMNYEHVVIFKINSVGDSIWEKIFSGAQIGDNIRGFDIEKTSDNGYVITGTVQPASGGQYILLIKTDENGYIGLNETENNNSFHIDVYPNPFSDYINIKITGIVVENATLGIYNVLGRLVINIENINSDNFIFYRNSLTGGMYFYKLTINNNYTINGKFIIK